MPIPRSLWFTALALGAANGMAEDSMGKENAGDHAGNAVVMAATLTVAGNGSRVEIDYQVDNRGSEPRVLHNRGHAVGSRLQPDRSLPVSDGEGGFTIEAMPLSSPFADGRRTGPTVPPVSLAMALPPGEVFRGTLSVNPPEGAQRLRLCLGVSRFDPGVFTAFATVPVDEDGVALLRSPWRESLDDLDTVCSDWLPLPG